MQRTAASAIRLYRDNRRTGIDTNVNGILHQVGDGGLAALAPFMAHQQSKPVH